MTLYLSAIWSTAGLYILVLRKTQQCNNRWLFSVPIKTNTRLYVKCFLQGDKEGGGGGVWFETIVDYEELCNLRTDGRCISLSLVKSENRRNQFHVTQDIALSLSPSSQHPASPSHRPQIAKLSNTYSPVLLCHAAMLLCLGPDTATRMSAKEQCQHWK